MLLSRRLLVVAAVGAALLTPPLAGELAAQSEGGSVGLEVRGGHVFLAENDARSTAWDADLVFGSGIFRPYVGGSYWHTKRLGSLKAPGGRVGLRLEAPPGARLAPFAHLALYGHSVSAEVPGNQARVDELEGFDFGGDIGAGLGLRLDSKGMTRLVLQGHRVFLSDYSDLGHWGVKAGLRVTFGGERAVQREELLAKRAEEDRHAAERRAAEERRQAEEARRAAEERERREAERRAAEEREAREAEERAAKDRERAAELERALDAVASVRETDRGLTLTVGHGLFAVDEYELTPEAKEEVQRIAAVLQLVSEARVAVEGHADITGNDAINQPLSENRAKSVRDALIEAGISDARIEIAGFSSDQPIGDNSTVEGRAQNRRVEVILINVSQPSVTASDDDN